MTNFTVVRQENGRMEQVEEFSGENENMIIMVGKVRKVVIQMRA